MYLTNLTIYENQPNFHSLAILICHLFVSGEFHMARFIYDPKVFNDQLFASVDDNCFGKILWTTTDLSKSRPKEQNEKLNILQLVFPDLDDPVWNAVFMNTSMLPYHLLMISAEANNWIESIESITFLHSNTLIVKQYQKSKKINLYTKIRNKPLEFIYEYDESDRPKNLFHETFGKVRSTWMLAAHYSTSAICFGERAMSLLFVWKYLANFFSNQIVNSFLNGSNIACGNYSSNYSLDLPQTTSYYKELDVDTRYIGTETRLILQKQNEI